MNDLLQSKFERPTALLFVVVAAVCASLGCNQNPYANPYAAAPYGATPYGGQPPGAFQLPAAAGAPPAVVQPQLAELERRVQQLDTNNRQLTTQLAQSQQQMQVFRDRADLLQKQLQDTAAQLQASRLAQQELQNQARGLAASMNQRGGATLRPNTSQPLGQPAAQSWAAPPAGGSTQVSQMPLNNLPSNMAGAMPGTLPSTSMAPSTSRQSTSAAQPGTSLGGATAPTTPLSAGTRPLGMTASGAAQIPGTVVQSEGNVLRIRVPADQLFSPGTAQLNPASAQVLDNVATALVRTYPRQRVAIEGHTDAGNLYGGTYSTQYQLAAAQAQAVLDQLVRRNGVPTQQLFTVAHGPNHPRSDNQSAAGRAENRRIEFVVYPDTF